MTVEKHPYVRPSQVIESMRDNGYKNTAYALAELIDNSIQAGAKTVRFVCFEAYEQVNSSNRRRIQNIAILDDGYGMNKDTLYTALEFGASQNRNDPDGMGKFGMGLPNSSISQCLRTDVWSWQNGSQPYQTYLDVEEIKSGHQEHIPYPEEKPLKEILQDSYKGTLPESGTVVVWSGLDRLHWKTSASLLKHTQSLIGRMYRYMLSADDANKKVRIVFENRLYDEESNSYKVESTVNFKPNDPLYLMGSTVLEDMSDFPKDFESHSLFDIHQDGITNRKEITLSDGTIGYYAIRSSSLKTAFADKLRENTDSKIGGTYVGRQLATNIGLSIVRAGRELDLKRDFKIKDQYYKDRYIGVEIEFSPSLDKFFGVTNNKQTATKIQPVNLSEIALQEDVDESKVINTIREADPDYAALLDCLTDIDAAFDLAFKELNGKKISYGQDTKVEESKSTDSASTLATKSEQQRANEHPTLGDDDTPSPEDLEEALKGKNYNESELEALINDVIKNEISVKFDERDGPQTMLFDISIIQGLTLIQINTEHNFYRNFLSKATEQDQMLLKLCLAAWGRMEKEAPTEKVRKRYEFAREQWGVMLDGYLDNDDEY